MGLPNWVPAGLRVTLAACLCVAGLAGRQSAAQDAPGSIQDLPPVANDGLPPVPDELPAPFVPAHPRSAEEQARVSALALFAAARTMQNQENDAEALRLYQRALRFDPVAVPVLEQIIPLALKLKRSGEAVRYALRAAELQPSNPLLLKQLGLHLTEQDDHEGAIRLYEKALEIEGPKAKKSPSSVLLQLEMGRLYFVTKQYEKSAESFGLVDEALNAPEQYGLSDNTVTTMLGDGGETYRMFGEAYYQAKKFAQAMDAYKKAASHDKDAPSLAYQIARIRLAEGKLDEAEQQLAKYFDAQSTAQGDAPYELFSELLAQHKKQKTETARLEKLAQADPKNVHLQRYLAGHFKSQQAWDRAANQYNLVLTQTAKNPKLSDLRRLAVEELAEVRLAQQDAAGFLEVLANYGDESGDLDPLDEQLAAAAEKPEFAKAVLELAAARLKKKELTFGGNLAAAQLALGASEWDHAQTFYNAAIAAKPDASAELILVWGLGLTLKEQYDRAVVVFQQGIDARALPPENPAFYFYMAGALELAGRTDDAVNAAREAVRRAENNPRLQSRLAWILYHANRYEEATIEYKKLIERFDDIRGSDEIRDSLREARLVLSNIAVIQGNIRLAEEWLEQVLDEYPDNISALNDLGYLWADQNKNLERALEMVTKAVEADPDSMAYRDSLGWALYRLGRYQDALVQMEKAADVDEPDGVILDHLAHVLFKLEQKEKAIGAWRQALESLDPVRESARITEIRKQLKAIGAKVPKGKKLPKKK